MNTPWLAPSAIAFLDRFLSAHRLTLFEWGCGDSTPWFAARCSRVWSVEHDLNWFQKISQVIPPNTELSLIPLGEDYWGALLKIKPSPDVVLIDGRHRKRCAEITAQIKPPMVIWDDAQRDWYQCCMPLFKNYAAVDFHDSEQTHRITRLFMAFQSA